ncbi:enoyl-CoA hydratase-related protein [Zavarzinia sp. CC-PAN008]|uniref:enoyl-CoA hydratase-related protein n=1 Tax=Zavarzinia sp. CC-PAN008 TaxID=3243332 RepID=UPI003F7479C1
MAAVEFEKRDRIAFITLNRPEARNAVNGDVASGMEAALDAVESDPDIWVAILSGNGAAFCAGADLKEIAAGNGAKLGTAKGGFAGIVRRARTKPLIAAIEGSALAGGTEIALSCDMIVCAETTNFGLPETKRSLVAGAGGLFRLPRAIGMAPALEAIITGDPIPAKRAYELGMVNQVVAPGKVMEAAIALATRCTAAAPIAAQLSRSVAIRAFSEPDETLWAASGAAFQEAAKTEDYHEGPKAFIEKRPPVWKGR